MYARTLNLCPVIPSVIPPCVISIIEPGSALSVDKIPLPKTAVARENGESSKDDVYQYKQESSAALLRPFQVPAGPEQLEIQPKEILPQFPVGDPGGKARPAAVSWSP